MKHKDFFKLPVRMQKTLIISMHVRNELESFHIKHLSDAQMKELNPIIRQAVLESLEVIEKMQFHAYQKTQKGIETMMGNRIADMFQWLIQMIPDYWEMPKENRIPRKLKLKK